MLHASLLTALAVGAGACRSSKEAQQPEGFTPGEATLTETAAVVIGTGPRGGADRSGTITSEQRIGQGAQLLTGTPPAAASAPAPKAMAYLLPGPYGQNVAVTLTPDGKGLLSYPAPTDITPATAPVELANGWWLSRGGLSSASVFTTYTRDEYAALPSAPTPEQLLASLIPGSSPTATLAFDRPLPDLLADTAWVNAQLRRFTLTVKPGTLP